MHVHYIVIPSPFTALDMVALQHEDQSESIEHQVETQGAKVFNLSLN